jgi:hypothetical protein
MFISGSLPVSLKSAGFTLVIANHRLSQSLILMKNHPKYCFDWQISNDNGPTLGRSRSSWLAVLEFSYRDSAFTGCPESPRPIPISTRSRHEEANLVLFTNLLSFILNDPGKTPDPVPEHPLDVVKNEIIRYLCNHTLNFITREKLSISQDLRSHPKEPKIAWTYIW